MDLSFLNQTETILDAWAKHVSDNPAALALTVDELSGRVYAWLKAKKVGREDFVFLCLPRHHPIM